ncbi:MAG: LysM peptidoglycan-binding domain-containing protein [Anaerolineae bacterium]|nr:LysM peptidoglycan-binding domain-containing protein [Anaerolineae bacterium]
MMNGNTHTKYIWGLLCSLGLVMTLATGCFQPAAEPLQSTIGGEIDPGSTAVPLPATATSQAPDPGSAQATLPPIAQTTTAIAATMAATGVAVPTQSPASTVDPNAPTVDPDAPTLPPTPTNVGGADRPAPTALPVNDDCTHVLQRGENLFRLSLAWDTTVDAIAKLNGITNPDSVAAGTVLRRPNCGAGGQAPAPTSSGAVPGSGTIYVVKAGDTLFSIANRFGVSMQAIMDVNPEVKANPDRLSVGQQIVIP